MAEIIVASNKRKRASLHIDLTPMVDLGFLLITFFMYTTTIAESKALVLNSPVPTTESPTEIPEESTITLILSKTHQVYYYEGSLTATTPVKTTAHTPNDIRQVLINKTKAIKALPNRYSKEAHKLHVLIKPTNGCNYDDVVKIIDEMLINAVPYYVIADITPEEKNILDKSIL